MNSPYSNKKGLNLEIGFEELQLNILGQICLYLQMLNSLCTVVVEHKIFRFSQ
jgi:hypothetical protein